MYIKITCSNGYCGCDENEFFEVTDTKEINRLCNECLDNYSFLEPDCRFIDMDNEEEWDEYEDGLEVTWEEISKEKYEEEIAWRENIYGN